MNGVDSLKAFFQKLNGTTIAENAIIVSFGVVSLFTAIPRDLAESTFRELLRELPDGGPTAHDVLQLLRICLHTVFTFDGIMYEQLKGTPMGASISVVIAEAVLQRLEKAASEEYRPRMRLRHVDDAFVIIDREKKDGFFGVLNNLFPAIQFTGEEESDH